MREQDEIVRRIEAVQEEDIFGFEWHELLACLDFDHAKPYLKETADRESWKPLSAEPGDVQRRLLDYLPFAWEKANNCRGISANRSISHLCAWLWLMGRDDLASGLWDDYQFYGKPQLVRVSEALGFDWRAHDDDEWRNDELEDGISANAALAQHA
jgi:hypothetical protein